MPGRSVRLKVVLFGSAFAAAAPMTIDTGGLRVQEAACAAGATCCPEEKSYCVIGQNVERSYYYKVEGPCSSQT